MLLSSTPLRHRAVPAHVLDGLDPCDMLDGKQVDGATLEPRSREGASAGECVWYTGNQQQPSYRLQFTNDIPPSGTQVVVDGRPTVQTAQQSQPVARFVPADGNESICQLKTVEGPDVGNLVEIAEVSVTDQPGQQDHACLLATDLATLAWSKLPPPANY